MMLTYLERFLIGKKYKESVEYRGIIRADRKGIYTSFGDGSTSYLTGHKHTYQILKCLQEYSCKVNKELLVALKEKFPEEFI